jgi:uncharacterized protein (TIGR02444 family)
MGEAFWRFSLVFYSRPGVADALLRLQDRDGCDINLMLYALWCGAVRRTRLDAADFAAAEAIAAPLRDAIMAPVRDLRRRLKPATETDTQELRSKVAALEFAAERRVQYRLADLMPVEGQDLDPLGAAEVNLVLYLRPERAASNEVAVLCDALAALVRR